LLIYLYLIVIVAILADKSQKVKSTRRKMGKYLCDLKHISYPQPVENATWKNRSVLFLRSFLFILLQINKRHKINK